MEAAAEANPDTQPSIPTRILLIDKHDVVRRTIRIFLESEPDMEVVAEAKKGIQGLELAKQLEPDVVIINHSLPDLNSVEVTRCIKSTYPKIWVIGFTFEDKREYFREMHEAGAVAILSKGCPAEELISFIRNVVRQTPGE